jgi:hypothetical protein
MGARLLVSLLLAALLQGGCATILQGSRQDVRVYSEPPAARVEVDGSQAGQTPLSVKLRRGKTHLLQVSKAGYEGRSATLESSVGGGWVLADLLLVGLIALGVDFATKDWGSFEHSLDFRLVKVATGLPAVASYQPAPADSTQPRAGMLRMLDRELVAVPVDGGIIRAKLKISWHVKDVELSFGRGLRVGKEPLGPFDDDLIQMHKGSQAYVLTARGRVVHIRVASVDLETVELEWVDESRESIPTEAVVPAAAIDVPVLADSTAALGGMLQLRDDEPVEFPVDGGMLLVKIHRNSAELRVGDGMHVGYKFAGPFSADRIPVSPGSDAYILTRAGRVVHVRITSVETEGHDRVDAQVDRFLHAPIDLGTPEFGDLYDELPLWSAPFGLLLLDRVPLVAGSTIVDVGAGTGSCPSSWRSAAGLWRPSTRSIPGPRRSPGCAARSNRSG